MCFNMYSYVCICSREQFEAVVVLCAGDSLTNQTVWKTRFNKYMGNLCIYTYMVLKI